MVEEVTAAAADAATALLSGGERARVAAIRRPARAAAVAVSLALTRRVLAEATGRPTAAMAFTRACARCGDPDHGRPRLLTAEVEFSVSRSERWAVVAVAPRPVGVDVEDPGRPVAAGDLTPVLSPAERRWAGRRAGGDLLGLWVLKEAAGKAMGLGIVDADRFSVVTGQGDDLAGWRPVADAPDGRWSVTRVDAPPASVTGDAPAAVVAPDGPATLVDPGTPAALVAVAVAGDPLPVHLAG
ncbi:MAG TPA: 4'-phosphopantetheinyl transferase superfamily protein [Acidimicrobiales bacterium]